MCCRDQHRQYSSQGEFNWGIHCDETRQKERCHFEMQLLFSLFPCTMMIDESKSVQSFLNVFFFIFLPSFGFPDVPPSKRNACVSCFIYAYIVFASPRKLVCIGSEKTIEQFLRPHCS